MDQYLEILDKFSNLEIKDEQFKYSLKSSILSLKHFINIKNSFLKDINNEEDLLINLYGLYQGLFVCIDGLYRISTLLTKRKWSVNINLNPVLHQIKYIRNDVVGHPNNRVYNKNIGYCFIDYDKTTNKELIYTSYIKIKNQIHTKNYKINNIEIIDNYFKESEKLLVEVYNKYHINPKNLISMSNLIYDLYNDYMNLELLENIKKIYINQYQLFYDSKDRFIWRLNTIEEIINYLKNKSNYLYKDVVEYSLLSQIDKLYKMANENDRDKKILFYKKEIILPNYPSILSYFKKYIRENKINKKYFIYFNERSNPLFKNSILKLKEDLIKDKNLIKFLDWFMNIENENDHSNIGFAIGSIIKKVV